MPIASDVVRAPHAYLHEGPVDALIATLAAGQHGVVAHRQLIALGVGREAIQHRAERGRLHRIHRGVYAVGHAGLTRRARWMAAVLAAGPGAALSHRSAAELHRMLDARGGVIHVTTSRQRRAGRGVRVHRSSVASDECEVIDGIPVTSVARTLLDLAGTERPAALKRAFDEAEFLGLTSPVGTTDLMERHPGRPGCAALRELLGRGGRDRTRTDMEIAYLAFCDEYGLRRPDDMNIVRVVRGRVTEADAVYREARLIVELDGGSHRTGRRFDDDRARDRRNLVEGWPTVRVTNRHLDHERDELAADLLALVGRRDPTPPSA